MEKVYNKDQRLTMKQKNSSDKQWYKDKIDSLDTQHNTLYNNVSELNSSEYRRMQSSYDICNNIIDPQELAYVCKPFGEGMGELPAKMVNRDIISGKVKALVGIEMKRAFSWAAIATNPEATTRKEQKEFDLIRQYAVEETMKEIEQQMAIQYEEATKGRKLSPEELKSLQDQIQASKKAMTPEEVEKYLQREHQDPAEVLASQLLEYLQRKENLKEKFDDIFEHATKSARELMYVGIRHGEPVCDVVNPMRFNFDKSPDNKFIEDSEWCTYEYRLTANEVISLFSSELTDAEIDTILSSYGQFMNDDMLYNFSSANNFSHDDKYIRVLHVNFKALREVCFLTYIDKESGEVKEMIVSEDYKIKPEIGDIAIEREWIPEAYEAWKIGKDIYKRMQPIPGQFKDLDNTHICKLSYYGAVHDAVNTVEMSIVDRLKLFQYLYNIVWWKLELLMGSDKGKKIFMNINAVPSSGGMTTKTWQYFMESSSVIWYDPTEEGVGGNGDVSSIAKEVDLSLTQDITKYIDIAEYIRRQAGNAVGITDAVEGQIAASEAVTNSQQNLIQTSHILEPYYNLHALVKRNVLQALLDLAKVAYSTGEKRKLSYVLDDLSRKTMTIDPGLLDNNTLGVFVANSAKAEETKLTIQQLTHAALQNQKVELSDVMTLLRQNNVVEAEETLRLAEQKRRENENAMEQQRLQSQEAMAEKANQTRREDFEREKELVILKEEEKRKTVIIQSSIMGASFNPDADVNSNGVNDFIDLANTQMENKLKLGKLNLDEQKFKHQKEIDKEKLSIDKMKAQKTVK